MSDSVRINVQDQVNRCVVAVEDRTEEVFVAITDGVQGIQGIQGEKGDKGDPGATVASGVSYSGTESGLTAVTVQAAIDEVKSDIPTAHSQLSGVGTHTHEQIDSHLDASNNPHQVTASQVGLGSVTNHAQVRKVESVVGGDIVTWSGTSGDVVADSGKVFNDSGTTSSDIWSASKISSAITTAISNLSGWMKYQGVIDCSTSPNYPAADPGAVWIVSVAGKIGGGSGLNVEVGDMLLNKITSVAGTQSAVGENWDILQANIDGAVTSTDAVSTVNNIVVEGGTVGKTVKQSLASVDAAGSINIPAGQVYKVNGVALAKANVTGLTDTDNVTFAGITDSSLAASKIVQTDEDKKLVSVAQATAYNRAFESDTANIKANGTVSVGSLSTIPRADHVHATDASREPANPNIQSHISSSSNPHATTYAQVGAEPANANIQAHVASTNNPHGTTASQVGAEPANTNIQSHISATENPHATTATQVGLGNVSNDAQLKRAAADFSSFPEKQAVMGNDLILVEDSDNTFEKAKVKISSVIGAVSVPVKSVFGRVGDVAATAGDYTPSMVGLGSVDNVQQLPMSYLSTDNTLAGNSNTAVPSQQAVKHYVDEGDSALQSQVNTIGKRQSDIRSTTLTTGGEISINGSDNTKFDVAAGQGYIVNAYTDPTNPFTTQVSWGSKTAQVTPFLLTETTSYINIDINGDLYITPEQLSDAERRDYIQLGWVDHTDGVISFATLQPSIGSNVYNQLNDFLLNFGAFNIYGNEYYSASGLTIARSAGRTFESGSGYTNNKKSPNTIDTDIESPAEFVYYSQNSAGGWVNDNPPTTTIDPNHYDDGTGTLADVPVGRWTIQLIAFYALTETNDIQYGQKTYASLAEARSALSDPVNVNPYNSYDTMRGWLIVKQGATDLADPAQAAFVSAGKLGMFDVSSGGGTGGEVNTAANIGLAGVGTFHVKSGVELQFHNIASGNGGIGVALNKTDNTVEISAVTGTTSSTLAAGDHTHSGVYEPASAGIQSHIASTSNPHAVSASQVGLGSVDNAKQVRAIDAATDANLVVFDGTTGALIKDSLVGLSSVSLTNHNHSGTYEAANVNIQNHIAATNNPHAVTASQVGLGSVDNYRQIRAVTTPGDANLVVFDGTSGHLVKDSAVALANVSLSDHTHDELTNLVTLLTVTKEPTGFSHDSAVTVTYDSTEKKVTLTGTFQAYWRGQIIPALVSGWVSPAIPVAPTVPYFLYYNGSSFVWSDQPWSFDMLQICYVYYTAGGAFLFGQRETHGFMESETHAAIHNNIGTYLRSGGDLSGYTPGSTTAANRRPDTSTTYLKDEDLETVNAAKSDKLYHLLTLTGTGIANFSADQADIVPLSGSRPYYNQWNGSAWVQTLIPTGDYMCMWKIAVPVTADAASQKFRYIWVQGQQTGTLSSQQALVPSTLSLGNLTQIASEFTFINRVIIRYTSNNWSITQVDKLTGSRAWFVASSSVGMTAVTTNSTLTGAGTGSSPLSVNGTVLQEWTPSTPMISGETVLSGGVLYRATAAFTTSSSSITTDIVNGNLVPVGDTGGDNMAYAKMIDFDGDYIYKGEAVPGSLTSAATWRISRTYLSPTDGDATTLWAGGVGTFTNIWDDHKTISYS